MIDNPFRKKTAGERLAENARMRLDAASLASQDAGLRAKRLGARAAEGASTSAKDAGAALSGLVPTVAATFAAARSRTAEGIHQGVDSSANTLSNGLDAAPDKVDHARDWIVDELLPRLQQMVDGTVDAKNDAAAKDGALSALAGETVRRKKRKGGFLMVLGLALLGGAGYFWYTDQQKRQGDPWKRVATTEDPWASTDRRAVSAAANPGAGMRPDPHAGHEATTGEKVHLTPSEAAAAREGQADRPVSALTTGTRSIAPSGSGVEEDRTRTERTTVEREPINRTVEREEATDARVERTGTQQRRFEDPATTGPIATGYADKADDIAGDNAPTQSIPTVGERLNPVDARPADNNVDPYGETTATGREGDTTGEKWMRN
ncbi:hypothetical protein [Kytococcus sp. Marseille-QA3725]